MAVTIDDATLIQIKKRMAYPSVVEALLSDDDIKTLVIEQALDEYFIKFPKRSEAEYNIMGETILDFPDDDTFGLLECHIVGKGLYQQQTGSFWDIVAYQARGYESKVEGGIYGSSIKGFNPNYLRQTRYLSRIADESVANKGTFKYRVNPDERKFYAYSSISAKLNVIWAKKSSDFSDVKFQFKWDVIKLAQGYLMLHMADTASIINDSAQEITVDSDYLIQESDKLFDKVRDKWEQYPDIVVIRE